MPDRRPLRPARGCTALVLVVLFVALTGCQARVAVDTRVNRDGSGRLTVGLGLDDKALARVGDPDREVRLGDLTAAGWDVARPAKGPDGLTWLRVSKPFADVDELNVLLSDLTGSPPMFRDFALVKDDSGTAFTHRLTGVVDTTRGLEPVGDPTLAARLGGDPFGGRVAEVERTEGRKVADMVAFDVTAAIEDGPAQSWHPTLADTAPTAINVSVLEAKPASSLAGGAPVGVLLAAAAVVIAMLALARKQFSKRAH